ncbi:cysteine dioxygenase family protein [Streptomyces sp. NPDC005900]|uniref:cysteine dioxygenase family protein n=1 Tax=Streptomyces sp. NPDC005900 TaxID=3154569 RepID=UPI00340D07C8
MSEHGESPTPLLSRLVADIRTALRDGAIEGPERTAARVARALAPHLRRDGLLTPAQLEPDRRSYRQHVLHAEPDGTFSVVALVWLPGQRTSIHDHLCWCVIGTYRGTEEEVRYCLVDDVAGPFLVPVDTVVNDTGTVTFLVPPGDIHEVRNLADRTTVSLHVYGADMSSLGTSIRRNYNLPVRSSCV